MKKSALNYIGTVYGHREFKRALELQDENSIIDLMEDFSAHNEQSILPQTDFTRTIQVNAYEAKKFIGRIETQISILETLNKSDEAKHWRDINGQAHKLLGIPYNGTAPSTQSKIESAYNKQEKK